MAPLPGRFISHLILRERCNEVRRIVRYADDFQTFRKISGKGLILRNMLLNIPTILHHCFAHCEVGLFEEN